MSLDNDLQAKTSIAVYTSADEYRYFGWDDAKTLAMPTWHTQLRPQSRSSLIAWAYSAVCFAFVINPNFRTSSLRRT